MAKTYTLVPSKTFLKDLKKLPPDFRGKAEKALLELKKDPYSGRDIKKLTNVKFGQWRLRIGDYRLLYDIADDKIKLRVIRHRKEVYRNK